MKKKNKNTDWSANQPGKEAKNSSKGYPLYPVSEDIYSKYVEDSEIDPVEISETEESTEGEEVLAIDETDVSNDESDSNLDVPGAELDDVGSEDEENNYYSIGGGDHDDLEEDEDV